VTITQTEAFLVSSQMRTAARELCSRTSDDNRVAETMCEIAEALLRHESVEVRSANGPRLGGNIPPVARAVGQVIPVTREVMA